MTQLSIDEVFPKKDKVRYPMILNFQNGYVSDKFTAQEAMVFENMGKNNSKTIATVIDELLYTGEEKSELTKTFILTRNKRTGIVRLIESGVTDVKPMLNDIQQDKESKPLLETSNLELSRKFGSKKHKTKMEQREKLKVNVETVTEQMQKVTKEVTKDELDLTIYDNHNSDDFYIPPINRAASTVEDIYDIDTILTEAQYKKIYSELEGKEYLSEMEPFIQNIIEKKKLSPKLLVLAVYANYLIIMYHTHIKKLTLKSFVICPHSATLNDFILNNFSTVTNKRRNRPITYRDRAMCHAIVFMLLINGMKIELNMMCDIFKLSDKNASLKARVTGASIVTSGGKKVAQLKLPLNTVTPMRRKSTKF